MSMFARTSDPVPRGTPKKPRVYPQVQVVSWLYDPVTFLPWNSVQELWWRRVRELFTLCSEFPNCVLLRCLLLAAFASLAYRRQHSASDARGALPPRRGRLA